MKDNQILLETIIVATVALLGMWFVPAAKILFALLPVAYLLVERRLRKRTWGDLGFTVRHLWADLRANWILFVMLAFVIQPAIALWAIAGFPEYLEHVQARLPFESGIGWGTLLPLLAFSLIGEEMTYRTLIQGRLTPFLGIPASLGVASLVFGLAHFAPGQYAGQAYQQLLIDQQMQISMSRTGNCYDNAPMESFFSTLKCEHVHFQKYQIRQQAQTDIFAYIVGFYNRQRRHLSLEYLSPEEFERRYYINLS